MIRIRPAGPADAPAIGGMHALSWTETYSGLVPAALYAEMTDPARRRAAWARNLAEPPMPDANWLAEEAGQVLGFVSVRPAREAALGASGEVSGLYLLRRAQGRGIGRALLRRGLDRLREAGHGSAGAWALEGNARAARFYAASGAVAGARQLGWHGGDAVMEVAWVWAGLPHTAP